MFKNILTQMDGVIIYPIISLIIFLLFFTAMGIYVFTLPKKKIEEVSQLPLND